MPHRVSPFIAQGRLCPLSLLARCEKTSRRIVNVPIVFFRSLAYNDLYGLQGAAHEIKICETQRMMIV